MRKMDYEDWNEEISMRFFNKEKAGREVLLYINEKTINQIGSENGDSLEGFIESIKLGPSVATMDGICQKALQVYDDWKSTQQGYPPYIAYLAFFVLAATKSGDFDSKAYYPRLREYLGKCPETGPYPSFSKMEKLWANLESWSKLRKHEELGRFSKRIRGKKIHIGLPLSQTLLSDDERKRLPEIFVESQFDPTNIPSELAIKNALLKYGPGKLEKRTLNLLKRDKSDAIEIADALIELTIEELTEWNGKVELIFGGYPSSQKDISETNIGLRVCLRVHPSKKLIATLRARANRELPDLDLEYNGEIFSCHETTQKWSSELRNLENRNYFDAVTLDWLKNTNFVDIDKGWKASLKASPVRVFFNGIREGFGQGIWIESQRIERNCEFVMACHDSMIESIKAWGINSCEEFNEETVQRLPVEWHLFAGKNAQKSCKGVEVLTLSNTIRLHLSGGIRIGRSNKYLKFVSPLLILDSAYGDEQITINDLELRREDNDLPHWRLNSDVLIGRPLNIKVYSGNGDLLLYRVIELIEPSLADNLEETPARDSSGRITDYVNLPHARGALVSGIDLPNSCPLALPTYLSNRIIFLGSRPGDIVEWPDSPLPESWNPVWALSKQRKDKWDVHFCGHLTHEIASLKPGSPRNDLRAVKRWVKTVWVWRKMTKKPELPPLRHLWDEYKKEAAKIA